MFVKTAGIAKRAGALKTVVNSRPAALKIAARFSTQTETRSADVNTMLFDDWASDGNDYRPHNSIVVTKFDKMFAAPVTNKQCQDDFNIIDHKKERRFDVESKTSSLSEDIIQIRCKLASEAILRKKSEEELKSRIDKLQASTEALIRSSEERKARIDKIAASTESLIRRHKELKSRIDKLQASTESLIRSDDESQRLMLIRTLSFSFQYALTQQFPGLYTTKNAHVYTFNEIKKKVASRNNASFTRTLNDVKSFFLSRGIQDTDINTLIRNIRELGPCPKYMTEMIGADGVAFKPSAADLHDVINASSLSDGMKDDARILLDALDWIVPAGSDLLYFR